jgi:hypothetical protein
MDINVILLFENIMYLIITRVIHNPFNVLLEINKSDKLKTGNIETMHE